MKKILAISVLLNAALVVGVSWKELTAHAAGGGVPIGNGDVNGDRKIDLTDAVYLLSGLFMGGQPPVPIEFPPPAGIGLPATGQSKCYDAGSGSEIDCVSADFPDQDGFHQTGCPSEGRFVDHEDGTVTDTCTGLMWQKNTADVSGNGTIGTEDGATWQAALKYCESLRFAGHDDWRLPNVRELQSIVDYGRFAPSIDPVFSVQPGYYFSSTTLVTVPSLSWFVEFHAGGVFNSVRDADFYLVRAVRNQP